MSIYIYIYIYDCNLTLKALLIPNFLQYTMKEPAWQFNKKKCYIYIYIYIYKDTIHLTFRILAHLMIKIIKIFDVSFSLFNISYSFSHFQYIYIYIYIYIYMHVYVYVCM